VVIRFLQCFCASTRRTLPRSKLTWNGNMLWVPCGRSGGPGSQARSSSRWSEKTSL
jgi:hypothetical protein